MNDLYFLSREEEVIHNRVALELENSVVVDLSY